MRGYSIGLVLCGLLVLPQLAYGKPTKEAIILNNEGLAALAKTVYPSGAGTGTVKRYVEGLTDHDWEDIFAKFKQALSIDPSFEVAKKNLATAENDFGLFLWYHDRKAQALKQFHHALYLSGLDPTTLGNLNSFLEKTQRDPAKFEDRVALGDEAIANKDLEGAFVEYTIALKLKDNPGVRKKLADVCHALDATGTQMPQAEQGTDK